MIVNGDSDNLVRVCEGDDIAKALKRFWAIGIIDDSQNQTVEDPFLEGLQFKHFVMRCACPGEIVD